MAYPSCFEFQKRVHRREAKKIRSDMIKTGNRLNGSVIIVRADMVRNIRSKRI